MVRDMAGGQALPIWRGDIVVEIQWMPDGSSVVVSGIQATSWACGSCRGLAARTEPADAGRRTSPSHPTANMWPLRCKTRKGSASFLSPVASEPRREDGGIPLAARPRLGRPNKSYRGLDRGRRRDIHRLDYRPGRQRKTSPTHGKKPRVDSLVAARQRRVRDPTRRNDVADVIRLPDREGAGEPDVVLTGLPWDAADPYQRQASLSTDGRRMLFVRELRVRQSLESRAWEDAPMPSPITNGTSRYGRPRLSPDGKWIATSTRQRHRNPPS